MQLDLATPHDDEALKSFFNEQILEGIYDYQLIRPNSFFDQYKLSTDDYQTYLLRDRDQKIHAMASILFKKGYVNDQEQTVGYVTDLRVANSRAATLNWTKEFVPVMISEREKRNCQFVFSELEQSENKAYNTLLHRRNRNTRMPRFHLFRKFFMIVVYGRVVFPELPLRSISIEYGRTEDMTEVCQYLQSKSVRRPLRYLFNTDELARRCREWPNFSMQNFLVARNDKEEIIGCMAPWNNRDVQVIRAHKYHGKSFQVFSTSQTLRFFKITRPLPKQGENFKIKHITHAAYDNPDIFYALLSRAYDDCKNEELLVYPNYYGEWATRPSRSFIHVKIPHGFYSVLDNDMKLPSYLHPNPFIPAPDFQYTHF